MAGVARLGIRNASRNRQRSVATVALMASATFVIVAVAAGRRNPAVETPDIKSGNGGFMLVAETSTPILFDLNTPDGRVQAESVVTSNAADGDAAQRANLLDSNERDAVSRAARRRRKLPEHLSDARAASSRRAAANDRARRLQVFRREYEQPVDAAERAARQCRRCWKKHSRYPALGDMNTLQYSLHKGGRRYDQRARRRRTRNSN